MVSRKQLMDFIDTLPDYKVTSISKHQYIVHTYKVLSDVYVDSVDFGAVLEILDNRDPNQIQDILRHFTYEIMHIDSQYHYPKLGRYIVKLLDFKHDT